MVKGVNKNIIEVSDTGNECFERAILFVRPESIERGNAHLKRKARAYLSGLRLHPWVLSKRQRFALQLLKWCGAAAFGAAVMAVFMNL